MFLYADVIAAKGNADEPTGAGALLRSFVLPGWGHYYANPTDWNRGKIHLATDISLLGSYFGFRANANRLEQNMFTFANMHAGTRIDNRGRDYLLSVADFNSLDEFNDYQERTRNWDRLMDNTPENQWNWSNNDRRLEFNDLNNRVERNRQQLPAIISLMVVNRLIAGVNAFTTALDQTNASVLTFTIPDHSRGHGFQANLRVSF